MYLVPVCKLAVKGKAPNSWTPRFNSGIVHLNCRNNRAFQSTSRPQNPTPRFCQIALRHIKHCPKKHCAFQGPFSSMRPVGSLICCFLELNCMEKLKFSCRNPPFRCERAQQLLTGSSKTRWLDCLVPCCRVSYFKHIGALLALRR